MVSSRLVQFISTISFGLILASPKIKWLAATSGPSMGQGSSLDAECDGMFSGALFYSAIADEYPSE